MHYRFYALLLVSLLISGCGFFKTRPAIDPVDPSQWQQVRESIGQWHIRGKLGLRSPSENGSANFDWQQSPEHYTIRLTGPLGQGIATIEGNNLAVMMKDAKGNQYFAASPEELLSQALGWELPISELKYWAKGLPAPEQPMPEVTRHTDGNLSRFSQRGWALDYGRYQETRSIPMPRKIVAKRDDLRITLVIKHWDLPLPPTVDQPKPTATQ